MCENQHDSHLFIQRNDVFQNSDLIFLGWNIEIGHIDERNASRYQ